MRARIQVSIYLTVKRSRPDSWQVATKIFQTCLTPDCSSRVMPLLSQEEMDGCSDISVPRTVPNKPDQVRPYGPAVVAINLNLV